jgi:hypothetical protein
VASAIIPVARALYLCDAATAGPSGKVHLSGVFNAIRAGVFPTPAPGWWRSCY